MRRIRPLTLVLASLTGLLMYAPSAQPHCDTLSGPVVASAKAALAAKDIQPLLKWVKPAAEPELRAAFDSALSVRSRGPEAKQLADRYFFETAVRLHRAGEGAPYTGLKAKADDPAGLIAASDRALDAGSPDRLLTLLSERVNAGLRERYERVVEAKKHAEDSVEAGRHFVEAYVEYVHFVEAVQNTIAGGHAIEAGHDHR